jgi:hypothetical protein
MREASFVPSIDDDRAAAVGRWRDACSVKGRLGYGVVSTRRRRDNDVPQCEQRRTSTISSAFHAVRWLSSHAEATWVTIARPSQSASRYDWPHESHRARHSLFDVDPFGVRPCAGASRALLIMVVLLVAHGGRNFGSPVVGASCGPSRAMSESSSTSELIQEGTVTS